MKISEILKNIRLENGLTQKELSERLKIGQATIACYESGQREPHIVNLIAYADFFECSLYYLAGRTDDMGNVIVGAERARNGVNAVSAEERALLGKYKKLSSGAKQKAAGYIDGLSEN